MSTARCSLLLVLAGALTTGCGTEEPQDTSPDAGPGGGPFAFPVADPTMIHQYIGVDHDPEMHGGDFGAAVCTGYDGRSFPWCYDGHEGSDYLLVGDFDAMDAGSVAVIAAADGVVISTHDGEYDRCHNDITEITCDGHPMIANHVIVEHDFGVRTWYWHLKKDSVVVTEGQRVQCGDELGLIGSSGNSSLPHLHFQVEDLDGNAIDPYAGTYSQNTSWWIDQGDPEELPAAGCPM
jgi:murein DD-endopeptidase MepM/ murein hydrolase activator NlpD